MSRNLTPEARRKGGRNRRSNHCSGCDAPLLPGETCAFCASFDAVEGTPTDVDVAHLRRFAGWSE